MVLLFAATLITTTVVGAAMQYDFDRNLPFDIEHSFTLWSRIWHHPATMLQGLPYSLTLLAILMAHELGHYLASLYHRVDASLPYFMPSPFLGTFGAFIRVRSPIYSKRELFDIGVAGPLAGFVFLLPALAVGLAFSKVIPGIEPQSDYPVRRTGSAMAVGESDFSRRPAGQPIPPSHRARRLGGYVRHLHEPAAHRATGWRPHSVLVLPASGTAPYPKCSAWPCCRWASCGPAGCCGARFCSGWAAATP